MSTKTKEPTAARDAAQEMTEEEKALIGINAKTHFMGTELPGLRRPGSGQKRIKGQPGEGHCFHVMSRMTDDIPMWDALEKEAMVKLLWKMSAFCGVELLTYCVMGNHFHALVRVPDREKWLAEQFGGEDGEEKLFDHLRTLYTKDYVKALRKGVAELRAKGRGEEATKVLDSFRRRFCELSLWTKEVKERFSKWINKRRERRGTLWMERFKSVLVQDGEALRTMALYIDLNPVRASLAEDPADYRWSGYGAAAGGSKAEQAGLCAVLAGDADGWSKAKEIYRTWLYTAGVAVRDETGKLVRRGVAEEEAEAVMKADGKLPMLQSLGLHMRHMTDGMVLGSQAWVEEIYAAHRDQFGRKRKVGARPLPGVAGGMCTLRG